MRTAARMMKKHDRPGIDPNDAAQTDEKKRQIEDQRSLRGTAVLVKGGPAEGDGFIFQQKTAATSNRAEYR